MWENCQLNFTKFIHHYCDFMTYLIADGFFKHKMLSDIYFLFIHWFNTKNKIISNIKRKFIYKNYCLVLINKMADLDAASLCNIKAILILDQDGKRILGKFYDKELFPMEKEQNAFQKNLFQKTHKSKAEIILLDGLICVYRSNVDLFFYVIGSASEDELIMRNILDYICNAIIDENDEGDNYPDELSMLKSTRNKQQQREKRKRPTDEVERRASKGRRIRYVEISKLVNFFPATPERTSWSQERRNDLFKSLFS